MDGFLLLYLWKIELFRSWKRISADFVNKMKISFGELTTDILCKLGMK